MLQFSLIVLSSGSEIPGGSISVAVRFWLTCVNISTISSLALYATTRKVYGPAVRVRPPAITSVVSPLIVGRSPRIAETVGAL